MDKIIKQVNEVIENHTFVGELQGNMYLEQDLGMDSLKRTQMIVELELKFNIEFTIEDLQPNNFKKVGSIYHLIGRYVKQSNERMDVSYETA